MKAPYPKLPDFGFQLVPAYLLMPNRMEEVTYAKHAGANLGSNPASACTAAGSRYQADLQRARYTTEIDEV